MEIHGKNRGDEMNAYELADRLDLEPYGIYGEQAANTLRQQADRIKDLEKLLEHSVGADCREMRYIQEIENRDARIAELEKCLFQMQNACIDLTKQNSEPVAWIDPKELEDPELTSTAVSKNKMYPQDIPLYTTPQIKELSDEEIEQIASQYLSAHAQFIGAGEVCYEGEIEFARAILKKASEK
jgi:hypothetical protein